MSPPRAEQRERVGSVGIGTRIRLAASAVAGLASLGALLFVPAGRLDWRAGWAYLALMVANGAVTYSYLRRRNPELLVRRSRLGKGTKTWDKVWAACFAPLFCGIYIAAGLDAGRAGSPGVSLGSWLAGLAIFLAGSGLLTASMGVNPFFEKTVRIQTEHGHRVIDTGPYRLVRHPGYLGFLGWLLSAPLLLGSGWAFAPALLSALGVVVRTALEDRTLHAELPGYAEYARRTRARLVPGLW